MKATPLNAVHRRLGAKMVDFGGWDMPVQYEGIIAEHNAVRTGVGVFDVSHMGEVEVKGPAAKEFVQQLITNNVDKIGPGEIIYSPMCNKRAGIVDDLLVYRRSDEDFLIVVNASTADKDFAWMQENNEMGAKIWNNSDNVAELAVQGPRAVEVIKKLSSIEVGGMKFMSFATGQVAGVDCTISRSGYTGEDGFELYFAPEQAEKVWAALFEAGKEQGIKPIGLGARDTLRLEAGLMLYGNDMDDDTTPLEAPLKWVVDLSKPSFNGKEPLLNTPPKKKLVGFELKERAIPRHGNKVFIGGNVAGVVTSGTIAPTVGKPIGFAFVPPEFSGMGGRIDVEVREGKTVEAVICSTRFYRRAK